MKKILFGFVIGVAALVVFLYFGGARYVKLFGAKTEQAGEKLEAYEKEMKEKTREAEKKVQDTAKGAKKAVDRTREKVKEYIPKE